MKFANHFFAATVRIQDLTEEGPEGVFFREKSSTAHGPGRLRFEKRMGDEPLKNLTDLFEGLLPEQSQFFSQFLLGGAGLSAKGLQVKLV